MNLQFESDFTESFSNTTEFEANFRTKQQVIYDCCV